MPEEIIISVEILGQVEWQVSGSNDDFSDTEVLYVYFMRVSG